MWKNYFALISGVTLLASCLLSLHEAVLIHAVEIDLIQVNWLEACATNNVGNI
jgi:hypothetical protein